MSVAFFVETAYIFLRLLFEQVTASQKKITILEPEMYKLSLNTSRKHTAKSCPQNCEGLAE